MEVFQNAVSHKTQRNLKYCMFNVSAQYKVTSLVQKQERQQNKIPAGPNKDYFIRNIFRRKQNNVFVC